MVLSGGAGGVSGVSTQFSSRQGSQTGLSKAETDLNVEDQGGKLTKNVCERIWSCFESVKQKNMN